MPSFAEKGQSRDADQRENDIIEPAGAGRCEPNSTSQLRLGARRVALLLLAFTFSPALLLADASRGGGYFSVNSNARAAC